MAEHEYELTVTHRLANPVYRPGPEHGFDQYGYGNRDDRKPEERVEWVLVRVMAATLSPAEYECVKRALIQHWTATD